MKGKIVLCEDTAGLDAASGAAGVITRIDPKYNMPDVANFPKSAVDATGFDMIRSYINSTKYCYIKLVVFHFYLWY